ncbi:hypothetical protein CYMTET_16862 [Cymbomonas tetramitiformis]|uniref:DUF1754-domain-containing protein n=1 Tax=Cymbomonas tetramitiformis TaxID=36881 RepID=A0AAE0GBR5_9CHLO|nr:hypothetical protein CYMTET_16862 [Cymbomonas tetramitiformis]|eukprot:gene12904-15249_t
MSSYDNVVTGKLSFKGGLSLSAGGVKKKKKKSGKKKEKDLAISEGAEGSEVTEVVGEEETETPSAPRVDNRTAFEKRFDEQSMATEKRRIQLLAGTSHKDKVKRFNEYLNTLTEHHDIPKVGPG